MFPLFLLDVGITLVLVLRHSIEKRSNSRLISNCRKQIAANTRRLVMSKHAQKVEESSLIMTKLTPVRVDGLPVDQPRIKGIFRLHSHTVTQL